MGSGVEARKGDVIEWSDECLFAFKDPGLGLVIKNTTVNQGYSTQLLTVMFADGTMEEIGLSPNLYRIVLRGKNESR